MSKRKIALVGYITAPESASRRWIATIVGEGHGATPHDIKQGVFSVVMELAKKIPGAQSVTVGLGKTRGGPGSRAAANRDRIHQREAAAASPSRRKPKAKKEGKGRQGGWNKGLKMKHRRPIDPARRVTSQEAYEIFKKSNGVLTPAERTVISHLQAWDVARMDKRSIGRQFSLGGETAVKDIAREGWKKLGLQKITQGFEKLS